MGNTDFQLRPAFDDCLAEAKLLNLQKMKSASMAAPPEWSPTMDANEYTKAEAPCEDEEETPALDQGMSGGGWLASAIKSSPTVLPEPSI